MQRKRHINFKLHSIPILLNMKKSTSRSISNNNANDCCYDEKNNVESNVLYSIPCVKACAHAFCRTRFQSTFVILCLSIVGLVSLMSGDKCSAATSASLSLSNPNMTSSTITPGSTATVSTNVTVSVDNAESYSLSFKVDSINLTNGSTTITAGNVVSDNTWGYKWDNTSTYTAPSTSGTTLTNSTLVPLDSNGAVSFTKNLTFGAKFSTSADAGHYRGSGVLSLVATPATTTYTITYDANGGSGAPSSTTCTIQGSAGTSCTTTLSSGKPTKTNYTFLGWADSVNATSKQYDVGDRITVSGNKTIYAIWQFNNGVWLYNNGATKNSGITTMQQMNSSICSQVSTPASGASDSVVPKIYLEDNRDGNIYMVRKFADGRCWMADDLILMGGSSLREELSSDNSDGTPKSGWAMPASNLLKFDTNSTTVAAYLSGGTGYYTWCTATAGMCSDTSSICPKNWKLPSGGGDGEFKAFADAEGIANNSASSTKLRNMPYNFTYTGRIYDGMLGSLDRGGWWSRTTYGLNNVYNLLIRESSVSPGTDDSPRYYGRAIRCVAVSN